MVLGLVQGAIGNPFGSAVEGPAFGLLNDVLAGYRSKDGIARPSRYEVVVGPPKGGQGNPFVAELSKNVREVSLKCESISFPARNIDTSTETNIYGPTREIATGFSFGDLTARFQCSNDMKEKKFFEAWQKQSFNSQTWAMQFYKEYIGELFIYLLDEQNNRRYGVKVWECFPKTIAEQGLDYSTLNEQMKLNVTFSYRYWTDLTTEATLPQPLGDRIVERLKTTAVRRVQSAIPATYAKGLSFFR